MKKEMFEIVSLTGTTIMQNVTVKVKTEALESEVEFQCCVYETINGGVATDVDLMDFHNVKFMGMPVGNGYKEWNKFKETLGEIGIDPTKILLDEAHEVLNKSGIIKKIENKVKESGLI